MRILVLLTLLGCTLNGRGALAAAGHPGYVVDVVSEKSQNFREVYLYTPAPRRDATLHELIFNPLTQEFRESYRSRFGELDTSSINYRSAAMGGTNQTPNMIEQENTKRKDFAEYMTRRLIEFHFDNYMKSQPQMKPVLEVKQKIQNVKVEVSKEVRVNIQYNFAGNIADIILENPYGDSKLAIEMDPKAFGPTTPRETRIWIGKNLKSHLRANSSLAIQDGIASADLTRTLRGSHFATTFGVSSFFRSSGTSARETKYIVGFSNSF
jgi:hypothetical protein